MGVSAHHEAEKEVWGAAAAMDDVVCVLDGGSALHSTMATYRPKTHIMRCTRHLLQDLKRSHAGRQSEEVYNKLIRLPNNRSNDADQLMQSLKPNSPLHGIPKEQLSSAYLPDGKLLSRTCN